MGGFLEGLGMQVGTKAAEGLIQQGFNALDAKRNYRYQTRLNQQGLQNSMTLTNYDKSQQMAMWKETGPQAQMENLKQAGLNPALMYGQGGQGGGGTVALNAQSQSGGAAQENHTTISPIDIAQIKLLNAQKENLDADTADKRAHSPVNTTQAGVNSATIPKINAETKNVGAQTAGQEIANAFNMTTFEARSNAISTGVKQQIETLKQSEKTGQIQTATLQDQINKIKTEAVGATLVNELAKAQRKNVDQDTIKKWYESAKTDQDITNSINQMMINWEQLGIEEKKVQPQGVMNKLQVNTSGASILGTRLPYADLDGLQHDIDELIVIPNKYFTQKPKQ